MTQRQIVEVILSVMIMALCLYDLHVTKTVPPWLITVIYVGVGGYAGIFLLERNKQREQNGRNA